MDMGAIGGIKGYIHQNNNTGKPALPEIVREQTSQGIPGDHVEMGLFSSEELKDPRQAFTEGPAQPDRLSGLGFGAGEEIAGPGDAVSNDEIGDIDGFYMSRMGQGTNGSIFGDFPLNGPGSSGITSLSGVSYNGNNPAFLRME